MNVCGIITEYNPFHNGHLKHITESKKVTGCDFVVAVMSGNFVQRGEPAVIDKFARTKMALLNGVDIVIELPVYYATAGAEYFARASVKLLNDCGIAESVCFGSESGDITALKSVARQLLNEDGVFKSNIKQELDKGVSYPRARQSALEKCRIPQDFALNEPNNILAVEYLKAIESLNCSLTPFTIKRQGAHYHSETISNAVGNDALVVPSASATAIRKAVCDTTGAGPSLCEGVMPENCLAILQEEIKSKSVVRSINDFSDIFHYIIATTGPEILRGTADIDEGLENRIIACAKKHYLITDIAKAVKTKRYVMTKINRAILHIILSINKENFNYFNNNGCAQYIRVLGFRRESEPLLKLLHKNAKIPVITNLKRAESVLRQSAMLMLNKEIETTRVYQAALRKNYATPKSELSNYIVIV